MRDLCIPIPDFSHNEEVQLEVKVGNNKSIFNYKVVSFPWEVEIEENGEEILDAIYKINRLKSALTNYDKNWELIQIFTPSDNDKYIQVLYRKKLTNK